MRWVEPQYGKKRIRKSGEILTADWSEFNDADFDGVLEAFDILSNWRSAHAYPVQAVLVLVRSKAQRIDESSLIVQRLKRTPSILEKLRREGGMKLERMEDIGGCRAVVSTVRQANELSRALKSSRTRHVLHRERNYILHPKESGCRGIHLVYRYGGTKGVFKGIPVEVQIRSKVQHSWATAVEVVGAFTKQALKASEGSRNWLRYFRFASAELAKREGCPVDPILAGYDTREELRKLSNILNVAARLRTFAVTTQVLGKKQKNHRGLFLLTLNTKDSVVQVRQFDTLEFEIATNEYAKLEKEFRDDASRDVVLVSASSIRALKKGYPNYFADTAVFASYMSRILGASNSIQRTSLTGR